jgi:hypothetical protein
MNIMKERAMTRFAYDHTRPKHDITQTNLEMMIRDMRITLDAHEAIGTLQRTRAIATIRDAREDVARCSTPVDEIIRKLQIRDERWPNHMALTSWLTDLSLDLKLLPHEGNAISNARLDAGLKLVRELDSCRIELRYER